MDTRRVCKFDINGTCHKGNECTFIHGSNEQINKTKENNKRKTIVCKFDINGTCHKGNNCNFIHESFLFFLMTSIFFKSRVVCN